MPRYTTERRADNKLIVRAGFTWFFEGTKVALDAAQVELDRKADRLFCANEANDIARVYGLQVS